MTAKIEIPSALTKFAGGNGTVEVTGNNVRDAINNLVGEYSGLKEHLFDEQGRIRSFVNIYLNDEDIRYSDNLETVVKEGDVIQIVPSIAGGR
ncbi:MAG: MoaD/ThiS family protein [Deltaproteobacteria bacterium]|nr:MoaD/ThiS family protein [Deltaproteobacteria bacterium]